MFNLALKTKLKRAELGGVEFWRWVNPRTIVIATEHSVYHWSTEGVDPPVKMFDRVPFGEQSQLISYRMSGDEKWLMLGGVAQCEGHIVGVMQLHSVETGGNQRLDDFAGCFATIELRGRAHVSTVFCVTKLTQEGAHHSISLQSHKMRHNTACVCA